MFNQISCKNTAISFFPLKNSPNSAHKSNNCSFNDNSVHTYVYTIYSYIYACACACMFVCKYVIYFACAQLRLFISNSTFPFTARFLVRNFAPHLFLCALYMHFLSNQMCVRSEGIDKTTQLAILSASCMHTCFVFAGVQ